MARSHGWNGQEMIRRPNFDSAFIQEKFSNQLKGCTYDYTMDRFVLATPEILNNYLTGIPRCPFISHRAKVIIILESNNTKTDSPILIEIMEKLSKIYGKVNIFLLLPCETNQIGYYDLFEPIDGINDWGKLKWIDAHLVEDIQIKKLQNFHGYPLIVSIFSRYPTAIESERLPSIYMVNPILKSISNFSNGFGGLDGITFGALRKHFNFGGISQGPTDTEEYGHKEADGRFTGKLEVCIHYKNKIQK